MKTVQTVAPVLLPISLDERASERQRKSGIYQILCKPTGKVYVGSAMDVWKRREEHRRNLLKGDHCNPHLQSAWDKYSGIRFEFAVLEYCPEASLVEREQFYIDDMKATDRIFGFNMSPVAGSQRGIKYGAEVRARRSAMMMGNKNTLGHHLTEDHKEKIRESLKGNTRTRGYKHTEESRKKMAASQIGRKHPIETIEKIKASNKGKIRSYETRARVSAARTLFDKKQCENIRAKKSECDVTYTAIAEKFNCSIATISRICNKSRGPYI